MRDLFENTELYVFDLDGTINLGDNLIDGAKELVNYLIKTKRKYLFFSNNSSRSRDSYVKRFKNMGFDIDREHIMSSADIMIDYLKRNYANEPIYVVGTDDVRKSFLDEGIRVTEADEAKNVVVTLDNQLTYEKLVCASKILSKGGEMLATHMDLRCPTDNGFIPDCGAIVNMLTATTDVELSESVGKPSKITAQLISEQNNVDIKNICFVGDRLYTDIAAGYRNGAFSILVLTGEATEEDVTVSGIKPDLIFKDVMDMYRAIKEFDQ